MLFHGGLVAFLSTIQSLYLIQVNKLDWRLYMGGVAYQAGLSDRHW